MPRAVHNGGGVPPELIGDGEHRPAETLDLERARRLRAQALGETVRRKRQERHDDHHRHSRECRRRAAGDSTPPSPPDEDQGRRQEHDGIDLGRKGSAEEREGGDRPPHH